MDFEENIDAILKEAAAAPAAEKKEIPRAPETFKRIICDLTADLTKVYPEYAAAWAKWNEDMSDEELNNLFQYCLLFYPGRFFDILNKNEEIFENENPTNTLFLPNVEFKALYNCDGISQNTRDTIWKYLQLILFSAVQTMNDSSLFGDAIKMFEDIDTDDLRGKLDEAMGEMNKMFESFSSAASAGDDGADDAEAAPENADAAADADPDEKPRPFSKFDAEQMHSHINELLNGKIGTIAKELAEEISGELNDDILNMMDGATTGNMMNDTQAFLGKLKENPGKLMDLMQKIVGKLKGKMASGDITQEDLMKELSGMMDKFKGIPGLGNMDSILKQFARGAFGGGGADGARVDTNAVERMTNNHKMKEKLRARLEAKKRAQVEAAVLAAATAAKQNQAAAAAASVSAEDDSWMDSPDAQKIQPGPLSKSKAKKSSSGGRADKKKK